VNICPMTLMSTHLRIQMIGTGMGLFLVLVELKDDCLVI